MLFGSFADKATVDLRGDTHHESARVRAFRQRVMRVRFQSSALACESHFWSFGGWGG
jgi:hypothetical protein